MANLSSISMLAEIDGVLLVDKPAGIAAHDVERAVKAHFNLVKTGHGATLDPGASGLFVILQLIPLPGLGSVHFGTESYIMLVIWVAIGLAFYAARARRIK